MEKYLLSKTPAAELAGAKQRYLDRLPHPIDGMWECFVEMADHYSIRRANQWIGYCVVNDEQKLVQFSVVDLSVAAQVFNQVLDELKVTGAVVTTCESPYLPFCMDRQKSVSVNAFMYHLEHNADLQDADFPDGAEFRITESKELDVAISFGMEALVADPHWLARYFCERIRRGELFGLWQQDSLIATGECRVSQSQPPHADLGIVVAQQYRGQGIATNVLRELLLQCRTRKLQPICSTERDNIAAQKAIAKSGFVSQHRILEVTF